MLVLLSQLRTEPGQAPGRVLPPWHRLAKFTLSGTVADPGVSHLGAVALTSGPWGSRVGLFYRLRSSAPTQPSNKGVRTFVFLQLLDVPRHCRKTNQMAEAWDLFSCRSAACFPAARVSSWPFEGVVVYPSQGRSLCWFCPRVWGFGGCRSGTWVGGDGGRLITCLAALGRSSCGGEMRAAVGMKLVIL